jgi:hypothetical protein
LPQLVSAVVACRATTKEQGCDAQQRGGTTGAVIHCCLPTETHSASHQLAQSAQEQYDLDDLKVYAQLTLH